MKELLQLALDALNSGDVLQRTRAVVEIEKSLATQPQAPQVDFGGILTRYEGMRIYCVRRAGWPLDDTSPCHKAIHHSESRGAEFKMAELLDDMALAIKQLLKSAAPEAPQGGVTDGYVQPVPDHCDRITWRNRYYSLPPAQSPFNAEVLKDVISNLGEWSGGLGMQEDVDYVSKELDKLHALVSEPQGWKAIETAPPNDLILLSCAGWAPSEARREPWPIKVGGYWDGAWHIFGASWNPTHWQHLPAAPTETPEAGK